MKNYSISTILLSAIIIALAVFSTTAKAGASNGLGLCESIIIPSLLPILIITSIIIKSRCSLVFERLFGSIIEKVFKLPKCTTSAILFGLIGGYPTGAILTQELYEKGMINDDDAKRIMSFNMCGGIAFIITAVGTIHLKSTSLGVVLYLSNVLSSIIIALLTSIKKSAPKDTMSFSDRLSISDAMIESVESSARAIINMCVYIILFSAISSIVPIPSIFTPLIEITNGIIGKNHIPLEYISFFLCFGGFCIHFQLFGMLKRMNVSYTHFFITRIIGSLLSFAITRIYLFAFPQADAVFSNIAEKTPILTQASTGLSIVMLLGCIVIIFDIENKKYKLI